MWNLWVFQHEIEQGRLPFYTNSILSVAAGTPVNLSLHNYTTFANLLALPLIPLVGLTVAFNLVFLLNIALTGWARILLARDLIEREVENRGWPVRCLRLAGAHRPWREPFQPRRRRRRCRSSACCCGEAR